MSVGARAADLEPSEFRVFTDKQGKRIEARVLSVTEDRRQMALERRDGAVFNTLITILSIDDQLFLRDWLDGGSTPPPGKVGIFGNLPKDRAIDISAAEGISDIESVHAVISGWLLRRSTGEMLAFASGEIPATTGVRHISANTKWLAVTRTDGTVWGRRSQHFPEFLTGAIQAVAGSGHFAALLEDGAVKVWGRAYKNEGNLLDPPGPLPPIAALASLQGGLAAVDTTGTVHCWNPGKLEVRSARPGDGIVEIEGSIFDFLARTKSGEIYEWNGTNPEKARVPKRLESEGPFVRVRCNGNTRAAQKEDGSWIAWGANGAGVVDHINSLGPVRDLAFFTEPGKKEHGYVIWIE